MVTFSAKVSICSVDGGLCLMYDVNVDSMYFDSTYSSHRKPHIIYILCFNPRGGGCRGGDVSPKLALQTTGVNFLNVPRRIPNYIFTLEPHLLFRFMFVWKKTFLCVDVAFARAVRLICQRYTKRVFRDWGRHFPSLTSLRALSPHSHSSTDKMTACWLPSLWQTTADDKVYFGLLTVAFYLQQAIS